ncbi:MAG: twin-arginine translocase TatA/TatE family subunit [Hymenobacteraceae bacterium]|nr:twin-arginine translocase TatA/TatE family subunit [Hymenobacteraceae bacterium]
MLFAFLGDIGGGELMLILVFILIFFGANRIPELARGLGKGMRQFRDATNEIRSEIENTGSMRPAPPVVQATPAPPAPTAAPPVVPTTVTSATAE